MLILLLPVCVSADIGFHPKATNNLLNFSLLQTADTNENNIERKPISFKYPVETIGGILGGTMGLMMGYVISIGMWACNGGVEVTSTSMKFLIGGPPVIGILLGIPEGVIIAGNRFEDEGSYWKSFLGATVGALFGTACWYGSGSSNIGVPATIILPIAGAVWGYHW
ncbi:MAG: hypothetical protein WC614_13770 [bacterium]